MGKKLRMPLILIVILALAVAVAPSAGAATTPAAPAGPDDFLYQGDAYGTYAFVGDTVLAGKSAVVKLGCTTSPGIHKENSVGSVDVPPIVKTGAVSTTADSLLESGVQKAVTSASAHRVALLDAAGPAPALIKASQVTAVSTTLFDGTGFDLSDAGSGFVNLSVLGVPVVDPAPNTTIELPGIGRVVLNEQIPKISARSASLIINMIHVYVTEVGNPLGLPVGSESITSHAKSGLRTGLAGFLSASAYGTRAAVAGVVTSGPSALASIGCLGGDDTNNVLGVSLPPLFEVGEVVTTAVGDVTGSSATVQATSTVQSANVLDGLITADEVKAVANGSSDGTTKTFDSNGSSFTNLMVDGEPLANVDPNTVIALPGVGTLYLYRVIETPRGLEVRMIELDVTEPGIPGVPVGTNIRVAVAKVGIR